MSIYHKHHIIPKHSGGTDDPSNIINLTIEEHAEAHKELYEKYGKWQDKIAWLGLSALIDSAEARRLVFIEAGRCGGKIGGGANNTKKIKTPAGVFNSITDAARYYNVSKQAIHKKLQKPNRNDWCYVEGD